MYTWFQVCKIIFSLYIPHQCTQAPVGVTSIETCTPSAIITFWRAP